MQRIYLFVLACAMLLPLQLKAQGCSQCRDNVAQSSPARQAAYRHTVYLMGGAAFFFCGVTFLVARAFGRNDS